MENQSNPHSFHLSFCIPTYKRPELLLKAIESIYNASSDYLDVVQLVITDDSTNDTNQWVIEKTKSYIKNLKHIRNPTNLGIDGNILCAVNSSDGEFAWIVGEDDLVCKNAVINFFSITNRSSYGFICSNYSYVNSEHNKILKQNVIGIAKNKNIESLELLCDYSWSFGFIGACIVNKQYWVKVDSNKYKGTFFAHVGTILEAVKDNDILMLATPSVLNRCGDSDITTWGSEYTFEVIHGWADLMQRLKTVYPKNICNQAIKQFEKKLGANSLSFLLSKRADSVYTKEIYEKFYMRSDRGCCYKIFALIIANLAPKFCAKMRSLKRIIKSFKYIHINDLHTSK
jgi:glycosyltransferase involved in cell wall biosynthesis